MEDLDMIAGINNASSWLVRNQSLLINYIANIVTAIVTIIIGMILARSISKALHRIMLTHHIDDTITDFLFVLIRYGIIAFTLIAALESIGIQTTSIITVLGAAGLAVSLALQGALANLAAGILLVVLRPFRTGDYIDLDKIGGTVLNIQIFFTTLRCADGKIVTIPNKKVIESNIINFSRELIRRNEFVVSVGYDSDIELVKKLLTDIITSDERILKDQEMIVHLNELGTSYINFIIRVWSKRSDLQSVYWDVLERIKRDFDANNISFPHAQQINVSFKYAKKNEYLSLP